MRASLLGARLPLATIRVRPRHQFTCSPRTESASRRVAFDVDRQSPRAPRAGLCREHARHPGPAARARARCIERVSRDQIAVAPDRARSAGRAERRLARRIVDVADIDVVEPVADGDGARLLQRRERRGFGLQHAIVGMKRGEMQGNVCSQFPHRPLRERVKLLFGIVLARNEQRRDLGPDIRFVDEIFERIEDRLERAGAKLGVEALGEAFQIDIRCVHASEQAPARLRANEAGGDGDVLHAPRATGGSGVERIFHEDDRVIVGVSDAGAAQPLSRARNRVRRRMRA